MSNGDFADKISELLRSATETGITIGSSVVGEAFIHGAIGHVLPGVSGLILSYKQKRVERNILELLSELSKRIDDMQEIWNSLSIDRKEALKEKYAGIVCDYVIDEKEPDKIKFIANGFVAMLLTVEHIAEERAIEYYDILGNLRLIDLQVLIDYSTGYYSPSITRYESYLKEKGISGDEFAYINNKLLSLRLLESDRDRQLDEFLKYAEEALEGGHTIIKKRAPWGYLLHVTKPGTSIINFFCSEILESPHEPRE